MYVINGGTAMKYSTCRVLCCAVKCVHDILKYCSVSSGTELSTVQQHRNICLWSMPV